MVRRMEKVQRLNGFGGMELNQFYILLRYSPASCESLRIRPGAVWPTVTKRNIYILRPITFIKIDFNIRIIVL
jgi:hypothetical protein